MTMIKKKISNLILLIKHLIKLTNESSLIITFELTNKKSMNLIYMLQFDL